jgi:hypothetical protein
LSPLLRVLASPSRQLTLSSGDLEFRGQVAGFLVGMFHGFTIVFNMIASLLAAVAASIPDTRTRF